MAYDDVDWIPLFLVERELLRSGQPHVAIKRSLEAPIDSEQFDLLFVLAGQRRVEEIEVEHRPDDVPLYPCGLQILTGDDVLLDQRLGLLLDLPGGGGGEEPSFQPLDFVRQLDHDEAVDVPRVIDLLRERYSGLLEEPIIVLLLPPLLRPEQVPAPEQRDAKPVLYVSDIAVGTE